MKINCPTCSSEIPVANIDLSGKIAKCAACNNIFSFSSQIPVPDAQIRTSLGKPRNFEIERSADGLTIVRKWFTPTIIFLSFFCLFWNGFMAVWFYIALTKKIYAMALFGSLHGAVGLGLLYTVVAGFLNKTYIRIAYDSLSVKHRPLPSFGQRNMKRQDIKQLYSKEIAQYHKHGCSHSYSVQAITRTGDVVALVSGLSTSEEALFLEQEIEKYLGIEDEPVRGEVPR